MKTETGPTEGLVSTSACANCGLPLGKTAHQHSNGSMYCCKGCADRTFCKCRVSVMRGEPLAKALDPWMTIQQPAGTRR
jgi:hypothetical protein